MMKNLNPLWPVAVLTAILAVLTVPSSAGDFPQNSPAFLDNFDKAMKAAKEANKPALVVFSAPWCPPCQTNKKQVYPAAEVRPYHDKFVWVYLNVDIQANQEPAKKFRVTGIPHIEFLNPEGKSIGNTFGGTSPKAFAATLEDILAKSAPKTASTQ